MTDYVLRMYETLATAEQARAALLEAGYGSDQVQIEAINSEAGPVAGNFIAGNSSDHSDHSGIGDSGNYRENFKEVRHGAIIKLMVAVEGELRHQEAEEILDRVKQSASLS